MITFKLYHCAVDFSSYFSLLCPFGCHLQCLLSCPPFNSTCPLSRLGQRNILLALRRLRAVLFAPTSFSFPCCLCPGYWSSWGSCSIAFECCFFAPPVLSEAGNARSVDGVKAGVPVSLCCTGFVGGLLVFVMMPDFLSSPC